MPFFKFAGKADYISLKYKNEVKDSRDMKLRN